MADRSRAKHSRSTLKEVNRGYVREDLSAKCNQLKEGEEGSCN